MYYKDNPKHIRTRTVGSRKPAPTSTHLLKGDPDSATSPSKYSIPMVMTHQALVSSESASRITLDSRLSSKKQVIKSEENNNNLSDGASPGFRSSSGEEESSKALRRKKLKKKKERDFRKRESDTDTMNNNNVKEELPRRKKDQGRDGRKSSSPDKSHFSIKQKYQSKDSPDRKISLSEENKPTFPRRASTFTNYDLADALRKISALINCFISYWGSLEKTRTKF